VHGKIINNNLIPCGGIGQYNNAYIKLKDKAKQYSEELMDIAILFENIHT